MQFCFTLNIFQLKIFIGDLDFTIVRQAEVHLLPDHELLDYI